MMGHWNEWSPGMMGILKDLPMNSVSRLQIQTLPLEQLPSLVSHVWEQRGLWDCKRQKRENSSKLSRQTPLTFRHLPRLLPCTIIMYVGINESYYI